MRVIRWRHLRKDFSSKFDTEKRDPNIFVSAGKMRFHGVDGSYVVGVSGFSSGLIVTRLLLGWLFGKVWIPWDRVSLVNEFTVPATKPYAGQTDAIIYLSDPNLPPLVLPWCEHYHELLPETVAYEDKRPKHLPL